MNFKNPSGENTQRPLFTIILFFFFNYTWLQANLRVSYQIVSYSLSEPATREALSEDITAALKTGASDGTLEHRVPSVCPSPVARMEVHLHHSWSWSQPGSPVSRYVFYHRASTSAHCTATQSSDWGGQGTASQWQDPLCSRCLFLVLFFKGYYNYQHRIWADIQSG